MDIRNGLISTYNGISASLGTSNAFDIYKSTTGYVKIFNNGRAWFGSGTPVDAGFQMDIVGTLRVGGNLSLSSDNGIILGTVNEKIALCNTAANITATGGSSISIGINTLASGSHTIAIGKSTIGTGYGQVLIGNNITETVNSVVRISDVLRIGGSATKRDTAIGQGSLSTTSVEGSTAIGAGSYAAGDISIALGVWSYAPSAFNFVAGAGGTVGQEKAITNVYFGSGVQRVYANGSTLYYSDGSGISYTINGSGATGSNYQGGNITIAGGKGTGTGAPGDIIFSVSSTGSAGPTLQTLSNRWYIKGQSGILTNVSSPSASAIIQADSTTQGFLLPRMTNAQRVAISSPSNGLLVHCTDATEGLYQYVKNAWVNTTGIVTNRQTASYTLALGDASDLIEMNVATANNLTVPLDSTVAFPIGTKIDIAQYGAGQTTVVATVGVTIRSAGGALKLALQYSGASLVKIGTDEWYLFGDITV